MDPNQMTNTQPQGAQASAAADIGATGDQLKKSLIERFIAEGSTYEAAIEKANEILGGRLPSAPPSTAKSKDPEYVSAEENQENQAITDQIIQKAFQKMMITPEKELTAREVLSHAFQETRQRPVMERTQAALDALNRFVALNKKFDLRRTQEQDILRKNTVNPFASLHQTTRTPEQMPTQSPAAPTETQASVPIAPTPPVDASQPAVQVQVPAPAQSPAGGAPPTPAPRPSVEEESIPNFVKKPTFAPSAVEEQAPPPQPAPVQPVDQTQTASNPVPAPTTPETPSQTAAQPVATPPASVVPAQPVITAPQSTVDPSIEALKQKVMNVNSKDAEFFAKYVSEQIEVAMAIIAKNDQLPADMIAGIKDTLTKSANAIAAETGISVSDRVQKLDVLFQQYRKEYATGSVADHVPTEATIAELLQVAANEVNTGNAENDARFRQTLQNALNNKVRQMQEMGVAVGDIHIALREEYERMKRFYLTPA